MSDGIIVIYKKKEFVVKETLSFHFISFFFPFSQPGNGNDLLSFFSIFLPLIQT